MRLSNRQKIPRYNFYNIVILIMAVVALVMYILEKIKFKILGLEENLLLAIPLLLIGLLYLRGKQIFEYDSDGESITIKNRSLHLIFKKIINDEFPKYKIINYEIINAVIFKNLYLTINSKKHQMLTLKYNISYLTNREINDLKYSLSRIINDNKYNLHSNED